MGRRPDDRVELGFVLVQRESSRRVRFVVRDADDPDFFVGSYDVTGLVVFGSLHALREWWSIPAMSERFPASGGWNWRKLSAL